MYSSDVGVGGRQLYARVVASTEALANIDSIDPSKALEVSVIAYNFLSIGIHICHLCASGKFLPGQKAPEDIHAIQ